MGQSFSAEPVVEKHTETDRNDTYDAAVSSCQGWRCSQEDDHSLKLELPGQHKAAFFAVFDGHGSAIVSKHAAESLWRHITENDSYIKGNFKEALEQSFLSFDREVFESYYAQLAGTTATSVLIVDNIIYCANIGDSRSVAAIDCECVPLSNDHKPENPLELRRILAAGGYVLGNRVNGNLALSRAFGDFHYKSNEQLPADQQIVSPFPEIKRIELNDAVDFLVLACDGIWDVLTSEEVVEFVISRLEHEVRPDKICEQLTTRCLATDYELVIGCDNMTVLLVCYTRGRSWSEYCTDIFNKNTKRLGLTNRKREFDKNFGEETATFQIPNQSDSISERRTDDLITSSSSEQSNEAPLNDSSDSGRPDDIMLGREQISQAVDSLFHLVRTATQSDEARPESNNPAQEDVPQHDDDSTSARQSDEGQESVSDLTQEQDGQNQSRTTEIKDFDKSFTPGEAGDDSTRQIDEGTLNSNDIDENVISSETAEIKLDDVVENDENLPDACDIEPIDLVSPTNNDEVPTLNDEKEGAQDDTTDACPTLDEEPGAETNGEVATEDIRADDGTEVNEPTEDGDTSAQGDEKEDTGDGS